MAAIIEIMGKIVTYDGEHWKSEDASAAELCEIRSERLPYAYYPDPIGGLAADVAKSLGGRLIHRDPVEDDGLPPGTKY